MTAKNQVSEDFGVAFNNIEKTIEFNPDWLNGTGYWDGAVDGEYAPKLGLGNLAKTVDEFGRRAVFISTPDGNIVLFERYQAADGKPYGQINYQLPQNRFLSYLFGSSGEANETKFVQLVSAFDPTDNIANAMAQLSFSKEK